MTDLINKEGGALQDILLELMKQKGINQRILSKMTGIREAKLSTIMRMSIKKLKLGDIETICLALGIDAAKILNSEGIK